MPAVRPRSLESVAPGANAGTACEHGRAETRAPDLIEALPWPIFAATPAGKIVKANAAALELLDAPRLGYEIEKQLRAFAALLGSSGKNGTPRRERPTTRDIVLGRTALRLHAISPELARLLCRDCILIGVERQAPKPLTNAALRDRFGLTPQQARITRQLVRGKSADEIARELRLSVHTVRRHSEAVLSRMGVTSRAALTYRILGEDQNWDEIPEE